MDTPALLDYLKLTREQTNMISQRLGEIIGKRPSVPRTRLGLERRTVRLLIEAAVYTNVLHKVWGVNVEELHARVKEQIPARGLGGMAQPCLRACGRQRHRRQRRCGHGMTHWSRLGTTVG